MANTLPPPERLDLEGDNATLALRWEKWKRSLKIYLDATEIKCPLKRRAALLLLGGSSLQEITYNLPGAYEEPDDKNKELDFFKTAIDKLDIYFSPKQNKLYERHIFRKIKQEEGEKFEKFVLKLRSQAEKCKYTCPEEHVVDQIVEKCASSELRKKILTIGDSVTLDKIITEANTMEVVGQQIEEFEGKNKTNEVNSVKTKREKFNEETKTETNKTTEKPKDCGTCGFTRHTGSNQECPAKRKRCNKCGKVGHFSAVCRTKPQKRKIEQKHNNTSKFKRIRKENETNAITDEDKSGEDDGYYIFNMNDDDTVECELGGVRLEILIDSGCKLNLITNKTWEMLRRKRVICSNQVKETHKVLYAYGSKTPLDVKGSFDAVMKINGRSEKTTVFVINGGSRDLLGKTTAIRLGVLKLGVDIQQVVEPIKHKPGKSNIADPLSRLCEYSRIPKCEVDDHVHQIVEEARPCAIPMHIISNSSEKDSEILSVKRGLYNNNWDESVKGYKIFENELFFKRQNRDKIPSLLDKDKGEYDSEIRDRDMIQKEKGREYGDRKRKAEEPILVEGDKVHNKEQDNNEENSNQLKEVKSV